MKATTKFLALPWCRQRLFLYSSFLLLSARVGLATLPFHVLLRLCERFTRRRLFVMQDVRVTPEQIVWAITLASRYVPGGHNCLVQALAAAAQLRMAGHPACLCIGVDRVDPDRLDAHAWVELNGRHMIGGTTEPRYTRLFAWDGGRA